MVVLLEGAPISTEELWSSFRVTIGFLGTYLTKFFLPWLLSLARRPALGRVVAVPNFFLLRMTEATVFLGTFNVTEMFWYPSSDLCLDKNPVSELYGQLFRPHDFVFALTCTVNGGTLYRQVCAFPNHVQSIEFTTGGLQSSCRYIKDYQCKQDAPELNLSFIAKGLNT